MSLKILYHFLDSLSVRWQSTGVFCPAENGDESITQPNSRQSCQWYIYYVIDKQGRLSIQVLQDAEWLVVRKNIIYLCGSRIDCQNKRKKLCWKLTVSRDINHWENNICLGSETGAYKLYKCFPSTKFEI